MYICVLSSIAEENDPPYDPSPHLEGRQWRHHVVQPHDVEQQIKDLMDDGVDIFLNLCDGTPDEPVSGVHLVKTLEKLGAAFTGADSSCFDPTRQEMKRAAARVGVPTPASTFVKSMADVERAARTLRFPMLVKPAHGYASFGIRKESRVMNLEDLKAQAAITMKDDGRALIEEFIEGREFTCLVTEDPDRDGNVISFQPVEFVFPDGETFKHYNMKWVDYNTMGIRVVDNPKFDKVLRDYTVKVFQSIEGSGYARCDFRLGSDGEMYMLEINPNCGIFYPPTDAGSADFCLMNDPIGHPGFMELSIRLALKRQAESLRVTQQIVGKREFVKQEVGKPQAKRQTLKKEVAKHHA